MAVNDPNRVSVHISVRKNIEWIHYMSHCNGTRSLRPHSSNVHSPVSHQAAGPVRPDHFPPPVNLNKTRVPRNTFANCYVALQSSLGISFTTEPAPLAPCGKAKCAVLVTKGNKQRPQPSFVIKTIECVNWVWKRNWENMLQTYRLTMPVFGRWLYKDSYFLCLCFSFKIWKMNVDYTCEQK